MRLIFLHLEGAQLSQMSFSNLNVSTYNCEYDFSENYFSKYKTDWTYLKRINVSTVHK